ncbi:hypothetical protein MMC10_001435 [Thelotrema lepadinum]|nr:hypothetical protein [Thelotrema lepadinum]
MSKIILAAALSTSLLAHYVIAFPKVVSMDYVHVPRKAVEKRDSINVELQNEETFYQLQVSVGTPPQSTVLNIDTGSTATFVLAPGSCQEGSSCTPAYDSSNSSTYKLISKGTFSDTFLGAPSVHGDMFSDIFQVGDAKISNFTMGVATDSTKTSEGLMGLGRSGQEIPSILTSMVSQGLINSHAFSLYLNDVAAKTGQILFGGYDTAKFEGDLVFLNAQPNLGGGGTISSGNIAWTSFAVTTSEGTTLLSPQDFPIDAGLDSGTTSLLAPKDVIQQLYNFFDAIPNTNFGQVVSCNIAEAAGSLDFGLGNVTYISVPFAEVLVPASGSDGKQITMPDGTPACALLISPSPDNVQFILGDAFLRSAYVVYDMDTEQIGIAQTKFNSNETNLQEIGSPSNGSVVATQATTAPPVTVTQVLQSDTTSSHFTFGSYSGTFGVVTGVTTTLPISTFNAPTTSPTTSSPVTLSSSAASPLSQSSLFGNMLSLWSSLMLLMTSLGFTMFFL